MDHVILHAAKVSNEKEPAGESGRLLFMDEEDATQPTLEFPPEPPPSIEELTDEDIVDLLLEWAPVVGAA